MVNGLKAIPVNRINGHMHVPARDNELVEQREVDLHVIEDAVRTILRAVGEDPARPGLLDTPRRVARMYKEMFAGLHRDPARHLKVTFPEDYDELVLVRDIRFTSMCEHHLLPFSGVAHVAYLPKGQVTGSSKIARFETEAIPFTHVCRELGSSVVYRNLRDGIPTRTS